MPFTWTGTGSNYNPDFIAIDTSGDHWIIEVKADRDLESVVVGGKANAAREAVNHFNADDAVKANWHYLLVGETDIKESKEHWESLKASGR